jgi:hypothetical protein
MPLPAVIAGAAARGGAMVAGGSHAVGGAAAGAGAGSAFGQAAANVATDAAYYSAMGQTQGLFDGMFEDIKRGFNMIKNPIGSMFSEMSRGIRDVHKTLFLWEEPLKNFKSMFEHMGQYTNKMNPYHMERFNLAASDAEATIGQVLTPLLDSGTKYMRLFADALNTVEPVLTSVTSGVADFVNELEQAARAMGINLKSSVGKSFSPAQTMGVQQSLTNIQNRAFSLGYKSPEERTATATESIAVAVMGLAARIQGVDPTVYNMQVYRN